MNALLKIDKNLNNSDYYLKHTRYSPCIGVSDRGYVHACEIIVHDIYKNNIKLYRIERHIGLESTYFTREIFDYSLGCYISYEY